MLAKPVKKHVNLRVKLHVRPVNPVMEHVKHLVTLANRVIQHVKPPVIPVNGVLHAKLVIPATSATPV
ncbi:MAG: hypothetical protein JW702_11035 [Clostridiales bacterium]|nr:hypothetical protein [Clostridiales bacterium]